MKTSILRNTSSAIACQMIAQAQAKTARQYMMLDGNNAIRDKFACELQHDAAEWAFRARFLMGITDDDQYYA